MARRFAWKALPAGGILLALLLRPAAPAPAKTLRVYHIGNSVTDTLNYEAFGKLSESRGNRYLFGRHMIPGAPLAWIWDHPDSGFTTEPFGFYPKALPGYVWDAVTLQPFDRLLDADRNSDLPVAKRFIDLALKKSPGARFYIYSRWPRREEPSPGVFVLDYDKKWLRRYTGGFDGTEETRDYFETLTHALRKLYPRLKDRLFLVPVGDVLYELSQRMKAGKVAGYTSISQVYKDGIHFNAVGSYIVGCTFYATLYRESPQGLPSAAYTVDNPALARTIQDAVWKVVRAHPLSGVGR